MGNGKIVSIKDIHTAAYLEFKGIELTLCKIGTRVVFSISADDLSYRLLAEFQTNPEVPILEYVNLLRRLRSRMLDVRDGTPNGNGRRYSERVNLQ